MLLRFLHFFFLAVFFSQQVSYAETILMPYSPQVIEQMVLSYNKLSQSDRKEQFNEFMHTLPESEQKYIQDNFPVNLIEFPDMEMEKEEIKIKYETQSVKFSVFDGKMHVRGKVIDLKIKSVKEATQELEKILSAKSFSLIDFLIPPAYAFVMMVVIALMAVAIAYQFFLKPSFDLWRSKVLVKTKCLEMLNKLEVADMNSVSAHQAQKVIADSQRILEQNKSDYRAYCSDKKKSPKCAELEGIQSCYESITTVLEPKAQAIDNSSRWSIKDFFSPSSKSKSRASRATAR